MIVLAVCVSVYLPRLGAGGLTNTEGHRAIPGWGMLESGDWLLPRLLGQVYLRKPPGLSWAIAASSAAFGETEFAARLPSALAMIGMTMAAMFFAGRWFGRGGPAFGAGLATVLTPWFWSSGRSAEIEALNNCGTCATVLLVLELMVNRGGRNWWRTLVVAGLLGAAMMVAALAKGPAGFAAIGSAVVVGFVCVGVDGSEPRPVARVRAGLWLLAGLIAPAIGLAVLYAAVLGAAAKVQRDTGQRPVVQGVTEFLWSSGSLTAPGIGRVLAMPLIALAAGLPWTGALVLPWWKRAAGEAAGPPVAPDTRMARALAGTCVLSLGVLVVLGVGNHRYAMPSVSFVPVLAGYAWSRWLGLACEFPPGSAARRIVAAAIAPLLMGAVVWIAVLEPRERARSGRDSGVSLGAALPDGATIWADQMIEARPEVLWYARREAARLGNKVRPEWIPNLAPLLSLPRKGYLLLRTDPAGNEEATYRNAGFMDRLTKVWEGHVHKFGCTLYRMDAARLQPGGG